MVHDGEFAENTEGVDISDFRDRRRLHAFVEVQERDVPGVNMSKNLDITLVRQTNSNVYTFNDKTDNTFKSLGGFFPINGQLYGNSKNETKNFHFSFELVTEFLRPVFTAHWAQLRPGVSVDDAAEWILRAILSLLTVSGPRRRSRDGLHAFLQRFLLPAIVREG